LGKHYVDYQAMEIEFRKTDDKKVVLRGMCSDTPRIILVEWMEGIFRHGDVACAIEFLITTQKPSDNNQQYHVDIQTLMSKHDRVFG
jgi:hypothetical protein